MSEENPKAAPPRFSMTMKVASLEALIRALLPVAKASDQTRPHLRGLAFDAAGGVAATDGHRLHYVETDPIAGESERHRVAERVLLPFDEAKRLVANLQFYRGELAELDFVEGQVSVYVASDLFKIKKWIATLWLAKEEAVHWRGIVPRTDRSPCHPAMKAGYVRDAAAFVEALGTTIDAPVRVFSGGELDAIIFASAGGLLDGIRGASAIVMPLRM
jgi:hypothetical protein